MVWIKTEILGTERRAYQASTKEAGSRALLLTHNATTGDAVVNELVLLGKALAGVSAWKYDGQPVLSFFIVEINKLIFLLC